jgi:hypothetical protein
MRYVRLGTVSSETEYVHCYQNADVHRTNEIMEFLRIVTESEKFGIGKEEKRWIRVPTEPTLRLYVGRPKNARLAIWAAVAVEQDAKSIILLKMVDTYSGSESERNNLLPDALDRKQRGKFHD